MKLYPLLAVLVWAYAGFVVYVAATRVPAIWNMKKIEMFKKLLGEKGTVIFFYIWSVAFTALGIWLFTL